ncbi:hypothetical protein L3Q65_18035 [Amycolatopsis sp. FU40]|uniref:hypothetical protein n=1 Tax=Amycolatopsis sp. FU40 TaxID=2914159 RepID=UPI001F4663AD|nr:hypothetical protein [Amycolatopsis sp. FU40]UKD58538.1 hypothetical protein L3Q65_18035 [Amycolatopsis sp. FU40]
MIVVQQSYFEPEHLEEPPQQLRRCRGKLQGKQGQSIKQCRLARTRRLRLALHLRVQIRYLLRDRFFLRLQFVIRAAQPPGKRIVRVSALRLPEDRLLALLEVGDRALERCALPRSFLCGDLVR